MTALGPITAGLEPIPGYVLRRRLGAGGFGEVWLADAPGGLKKAVKVVYGTLDQERASSELRSLQRIRQVTHPFLLSLERIEIVGSQIVIVTELAECSVLDRYQQFRNKDLPGIPRDVLLDYLRDAADALDFLSQKHKLQHLDVKPGNLLLIADRIKVADFGLVKDLHERNQSLVGGLTPTYAAPEIFDGRPNRRSDQYSLAIVFQEMLTGQMPFNGRTTAELARQHLSQPPDLTSLPPSDRPIILRALSKNPLDRFSSCRQMVDQLCKVRSVAAALPTENGRSAGDVSKPLTTSERVTVTSTSLNARHVVKPRLEVEGNCQTWVPPRCLFVGLGGMGCASLAELHRFLHEDIDAQRPTNDHAWFAIDTDSDSLDAITLKQVEPRLPASAAAQIQLYKPQEYRNAHSQLFRSLSRRWLYNIPRSLKTEGVRPLGMLAMLDHYDQIKRSLTIKLEDLVRSSLEESTRTTEPIRVYLLSSAHGGTGSAMFTEMGYLVRDVFRESRWHNYRLCGVLSTATTVSATHSEMAASAAVACLTELTYCMQRDALVPPIHHENPNTLGNPERSFDWVNLIDGGLYGVNGDATNTGRSMAESIWLDSHTMLGSVLGGVRCDRETDGLDWLRTQRTSQVRSASKTDPAILSRACTVESISKASAYIHGGRSTLTEATTCGGEMPLTPVAIEDILGRLLDDLKFHFSDPEREEEFLTAWVFRLSDVAQEVEGQFQLDQKAICDWLRFMVNARVYNWRQLEKLQLRLIEQIMDMASNSDSPLISFLSQFEFPGTAAEVRARIQDYLQRFAQACLVLLRKFQDRGRDLGNRFASWSKSLEAEQSLADNVELPGLETFSNQWQQIATRVVAVISTMVQRIYNQALDEVSNTPAKNADLESINLSSLLIQSRDLCERFARELRIALHQDSTSQRAEAETGVSLGQLTDFLPELTSAGGEVHRPVVVPQDQSQSVFELLKRLELSDTTTIVPSALSRHAYVAADAGKLNLAGIVGAMWRPNNNILQLAERLLARVDVEWPSVVNILEPSVRSVEARPSGSSVAASGNATDVVPAPLPSASLPMGHTERINVI